MAQRTATANWQGDLIGGSGTVSSGSGVVSDQPVTWAARTESSDGKTSPEDLIAAAHASCYAMALSHALAENGTPATSVDVTATVGFEPQPEGGFAVTYSNLSVKAAVDGLTQDQFAEVAKSGEAGCPVSNALRGNVAIDLDASLA